MLELTKDVLRGWMDAGYASAAQAHGVEDASWWPKEARCGQSECTAWAWAAFLAAASDLRGGSWGSVKFAANRGKNWDVRQAVLLDAGFPEEQQSRHEILVDFSLHDWNANPPVLATAESEMCSTWGVGPSMNGDDDYTWDFYKLLQVVSPFRLFFCRVGPRDNDTGSARRDRLLASLTTVFDWYSKLVPEGAQVAAVILSQGWESEVDWQDARYVIFRQGQAHESGLLGWEDGRGPQPGAPESR